MPSTNYITIAGLITGEAHENVTQSGSRVVKRQLLISSASFRNGTTESFLTVTIDSWNSGVQEQMLELEEGAVVLVEGSFHIYKHQMATGNQYTNSITVTNLLVMPEGTELADVKWNTINLVGRVSFGGDSQPNIRYFESGSAVSNFSLAVNRPAKNADPDWFNISAWNSAGQDNGLASRCANYLEKGRMISVQGQLTFSTYKSRQTGEDVTKLEVKINDFQFLGGKGNTQDSNHAEPTPEPIQPEPTPVKPVVEPPASTTTTAKKSTKKSGSKAKAEPPTTAATSANLDDVPF